MKEYFESEMRLLQEAAQEFSEAYPEQAAMLNLKAVRDRDPYVERLLEGMAFLTAQVRERIDDGVPELSENLLDQLNPSLCRPFPSYTLVRITPTKKTGKTVEVERGASVVAFGVGPQKTECEYSTTSSLLAQPITVEDVIVNDRIGGGTRITLHIGKLADFEWTDLNFTDLPIHLHTDHALAYSLYEAATHPQAKVSMAMGRHPLPCESRISAAMLEPDDCFLPTAGRSHIAFNLLHDYFNAREKYLFFKVEGFDSKQWPEAEDRLTLTLESPVSLPSGHHIRREAFQLNTVPAVNLFVAQANPVVLTGKVPDYPLRISQFGGSPDSKEEEKEPGIERDGVDNIGVYSVLDVSVRNPTTGRSRTLKSLHELSYRFPGDPTYSTHTRTVGKGRRQIYISVNGVDPKEDEVLSTDVLATNGSYPRQYLEIGEIETLMSASTKEVEVSNISRPTKMLNPPSIHDFQWQLISIMSLHLSRLDDVEHFQALLSLFDWSGQVENQNRIRAIERIYTEVKNQIRQGVLVQGLQITLEVKESGFSSQSDLYLFGTVLHHFFTAYANITEYVETKVISLPTYKEWIWKPSRGNRAIL